MSKNQASDCDPEAGFSLTETLAALFILSLLMLPLSSLVSMAGKAMQRRADISDDITSIRRELDAAYLSENTLKADFSLGYSSQSYGSEFEFQPRVEIADDCRYDIVGRRCR